MKIGFIGLGLMGSRMANNLLEKGNELMVYNRSIGKAKLLVEKGAELAGSPADIGKNVNIIFTMLSEPEVVEEIAFGNKGFIDKLEQGSIWIDCSTVSPSFTKKTALRVKKKNIRFIDAPVSGSVIQAEKGELRFYIGGDQNDFEEFRPLFEAMGNKFIYLGENGKGISMKMVNNLLLAHAMVAFSEGMALGESLGLSKEQLLDILPGGSVVAPFLTAKIPNIKKETFETEFPLKWMLKDCFLASIEGYENNVPLYLTDIVKNIYQNADIQGFGEKDFSSIYQFIKNRNKL
jgi:3-hydroxyisobutyrate dehydrogenase/glyoxylate/succinic semialdehyde reductase